MLRIALIYPSTTSHPLTQEAALQDALPQHQEDQGGMVSPWTWPAFSAPVPGKPTGFWHHIGSSIFVGVGKGLPTPQPGIDHIKKMLLLKEDVDNSFDGTHTPCVGSKC